MRLMTIAPINSGFALRADLDPKGPDYHEVLKSLPPKSDYLEVPNRDREDGTTTFGHLSEDNYDVRLMIFRPEPQPLETSVTFHFYSNGMCILEAAYEIEEVLDSEAIEKLSEALTRQTLDFHSARLNEQFSSLSEILPKTYLDPDRRQASFTREDVVWISRAVILPTARREEPDVQAFIREWLAETVDYEDADDIISGRSNHSVSWVNYLFIDDGWETVDRLIPTLRIAQSFFSAQYVYNRDTQTVIGEVGTTKNVRQLRGRLTRARERMQFLQIQSQLNKSFLRRSRRRQLDEILAAWEFDALVENGERLIQVCSGKIDEMTAERTDRSSLATDLILTFLTLFIVIELAVNLIAYSRSLMSNPALSYEDDRVSWILRFFAGIDTDIVLLGGVFSMLGLAAYYVYWKLRK